MQETTEKPSTGLDEATLGKLRELLPKRYYGEFEREFAAKFGKKEKVPSRQSVYEAINGIRYNQRVYETLKSMADKRLELTRQIKETVGNA